MKSRKRLRYWWLTYGVDILCPFCRWSIIRIEEVWCGCGPRLPRKVKKWVKGRRAAYLQENGVKIVEDQLICYVTGG